MFLVFVGVAKLLPEMIRSAFVGPAVLLQLVEFQAVRASSVSSLLSPPLRI
jgi:tryptophanase